MGPITFSTPTLQWSPVANAVGYEVELTDTTAGVNPGFPVSRCRRRRLLRPPARPLSPGHSYADWQVEAFDQQGLVTLWGNGQPFDVPPATPQLVAPSGPTDSTKPNFQWSAASGHGDPQDREITDITGGGSVVVVGPTVVGTTPTTPAALSVGHTYQWQVAAIDASGAASPWSSPTIFHVSPAAPTPTNPPAGGETSTTPTLQWSTASAAP